MAVDNNHKTNETPEELTDVEGVKTQAITPKDLLHFAKGILFVLSLLFIASAIISAVWPNSTVFEACKTILPPIATLVIGYYFGKT